MLKYNFDLINQIDNLYQFDKIEKLCYNIKLR